MKYLHRTLEQKLKEYIKAFPVVGITGPRQAGKSTMLQYMFGDEYRYVTFDDYRIINFFYEDPQKFIKIYNNKIIFDEVQKVPEIFSYIKIAVDNDRQNYGKFILTGSSQFSFLRKISESLAGRMGILNLLPFQYSEIPDHLKSSSIYKSGYPELITRNYEFSDAWYSAYIETYLEKDIRLLYNVGDLRDFRRFLSLLASKTSNILNMSRFSNDLGITISTIKHWLYILEASFIIFFLPPYYKNLGKRIIKSPKIYFYDTGLALYLSGFSSSSIMLDSPYLGIFFENYIISEINKKNIHLKTEKNLFYFKTSNKEEIDLIEENHKEKKFIEIKSNATFKPLMTKTLKSYIKKNDKGYILYQGEDFPYLENIKILNYQNFLTKNFND